MANPKPDDLVARFRRLPQAEQQRALAYVEQLDRSAYGSVLLSHVNTIPADDLDEMSQVIDEDCERVDADGW